ncbi:Seven TM Receptor [Caenorhabditis elegans]|nr:Seven TM Receptor [Caenorhabditis elegans]CUV67110.1 Seven TM Receptor [Caenorhabditis elegans]|eukprot:NP_001305197.1 Seven TM Receptor [Caenorhabditis elegans]
MEISNLPRFPMLPYAADGSLRWKSLVYLPICIFLIGIHYIIIIYCCLRMHFSMKKELAKFSTQNQKLQRQFFHALIVQTLGPTIFLVIPASPILVLPLLAPMFGFDIDLQTGNLFAFVGFYPPFDSIAFMIIVKEYVKVIKKHVLCGLGTDNQVSAVEAFTQNVQS